MTVLSFDDTNGNGITRENDFDAGDTFSSRTKNTNYGGTGGSNNTLTFYQGTGSGARKVGSTGGFGFSITGLTARDTTTATYRTALVKMWITNYQSLNAAGMDFCIGDSTDDQHWWTVADDGTIPTPGWEIPTKGGFVIKPVDLTLRAFLRGSVGSPLETAVTVVSAWIDLASTAGNDQNLIIDALDYIETGFHVVGGTGADPSVKFQDFVDEDEGEGSTNFDRVGLWQTLAPGVFQFFGRNEVGRTYGNTSTETDFEDSDVTIVCPGGYVRAGFNVLEFDIATSGSVQTLDNVNLLGIGRNGKRLYFDGTLEAGTGGGDVDTTADEINYVGHGLITGEQILYDRNGNTGSYVTGAAGNGESELVTGTTGEYYYAIRVSDDVFAVAASFANALAGTRLALSAVTNELHYFERGPDTRYDLIVTGNTGTWDFTNGNINNPRQVTLSGDNAEIENSNITSPSTIDLNGGGLITNCSINSPLRTAGQTLMDISGAELEGITNTTFTGGSDLRGPGHAVTVNDATGAPFDSVGNVYNGYASYSGTDHEFDGSSASVVDTTGNDITISGHPYTDGEMVYYEDNGGGPIGGLSDGGLYYIGSIDANTVALYNNREDAIDDQNRISLTTVGTGTTHRFDSANAAIHNNSGSSWTLSVSAGGSTPSIRNTGAISVTVSNTTQVTFDQLRDSTEVRIYSNSSGIELGGIENATAGSPDNRNFAISLAPGTLVDYVLHNVNYEYIRVNGFTWPASNQTLDIQQRLDRNVI